MNSTQTETVMKSLIKYSDKNRSYDKINKLAENYIFAVYNFFDIEILDLFPIDYDSNNDENSETNDFTDNSQSPQRRITKPNYTPRPPFNFETHPANIIGIIDKIQRYLMPLFVEMIKKKNKAINQFYEQKETIQMIDKGVVPFENMTPYWYILINPFQYLVQSGDDLLYFSIIDSNIINLKSIFAAYKCKNKEGKFIQLETTLSLLMTEYLKKLKAEQLDIYTNLSVSIFEQKTYNYYLPIYEDINTPKPSDPNCYTVNDALKRLAYYESNKKRKYVITGFENNSFNCIPLQFNYQGTLPIDSYSFILYYYYPTGSNSLQNLNIYDSLGLSPYKNNISNYLDKLPYLVILNLSIQKNSLLVSGKNVLSENTESPSEPPYTSLSTIIL